VRGVWGMDPEAAWALRRATEEDLDVVGPGQEDGAGRAVDVPGGQPTDSATCRATATASSGR
jgi:hypothetical protein